MADKRKNSRICENVNFAAKEAFKRLRHNIESAFDADGKSPVIGITSAQPSEGKSTVSINLAYSLAEHGHKVILVDADMRRASVYARLDINRTPGLSALLTDSNDIASCVQKYTSSKSETSFDVIASGDAPSNPAELLDSSRMHSLMKSFSTYYDYVILDLPPVGAVIDAVSISRETDGMIVVIHENNCPRSVFSDCIDQLEQAKANILGFVMNGAMEGSGKKSHYNNYKYNYRY